MTTDTSRSPPDDADAGMPLAPEVFAGIVEKILPHGSLASDHGGAHMPGRKEQDQPAPFISGSLRQVVPDAHVLVQVDAVLDLSWLCDDIADLYCADNGRPGIDPEVAVRLMLTGFLPGIVHDRRSMRKPAVNTAIRWFVVADCTKPCPIIRR